MGNNAMSRRLCFKLPAVAISIIGASIISCALFRDFKTDNFTNKCTHCHGDQLQGINNTKATCGKCHDTSVPLSPENISDPEKKETVLSDPHIHKTKNIYSGTPSCFYCHRNGSF